MGQAPWPAPGPRPGLESSRATARERERIEFWLRFALTLVSGLTDATEAGLNAKIDLAYDNFIRSERAIMLPIINSRQPEIEAYSVSDPIPPQYFYQGVCNL